MWVFETSKRPLAADIFRSAGADFWRVRGIANYKLTDYKIKYGEADRGDIL